MSVSNARWLFLVPLVLTTAGCKTEFHLTHAGTEASVDSAVTYTVETDMDLDSSEWKSHMLQFRFVVVRGGECLTGGMIEKAKRDLEGDFAHVSVIFDHRNVPEERRAKIIEENGVVERSGTTASGKWLYRIRIPRSRIPDDSADASDSGSSCWLAGTIVVIKYMLEPWAESDLLIARLPGR